MADLSAEDRERLFVTIEPAGFMRWDWQIQMFDPMAGFHDNKKIGVSLEDGDTARTSRDRESAACGNTKTKKGAEMQVARALKTIRSAREHMRQDRIEYETDGGPLAGY